MPKYSWVYQLLPMLSDICDLKAQSLIFQMYKIGYLNAKRNKYMRFLYHVLCLCLVVDLKRQLLILGEGERNVCVRILVINA